MGILKKLLKEKRLYAYEKGNIFEQPNFEKGVVGQKIMKKNILILNGIDEHEHCVQRIHQKLPSSEIPKENEYNNGHEPSNPNEDIAVKKLLRIIPR